METIKRGALSLALAAGLAGLSAAAGAATTDETEHEFVVAAGEELVVDIDDGAVSIQTHDENRAVVRVYRTVRAGSEEAERAVLDMHRLSVVHERGQLRLKGRLPKEARRLYRGMAEFGARFEVLVPKRFDARIRTSDGDVSLAGLEGALDLKTSDGAVSVQGGGGRLDARTSDGDIAVRGFSGSIALQTSDGHIEVEGSGGRLEARTSDGDILASLDSIKDGCTLATSDGHIEVRVDAAAAITLDGRVADGRIRSDLPVAGSVGRNRVEGDLNGGGPLLSMRTSDGDIRIKSR